MTDVLTLSFAPSSEAVENRVGDETVILHLGNSSYYGLDPVGTVIWERLKDGQSLTAIRDALVATYRVPAAQIEADMRAFLSDMSAQGIIVET